MHAPAAPGAVSQPIAAASHDGTTSHEALLLHEAAVAPDRAALRGPAAASAAAHESSAAAAASPSMASPSREGISGVSKAAAPSCNMADSQLPSHLPVSSHQDPQGCVIIQSDEDEVDTQAQQQQATVSTSTGQSAVFGSGDAPSTQDGSKVQQTAFPSSDGSGNTNASLYPFPTQRSPQDRLERIVRSGACAQDLQGLYVFGRRGMTLAELAAAAGQAEGQGKGQVDGQADWQADRQSNGQAAGQTDWQAYGKVEGQADGQGGGQADGPAQGHAKGQPEGQANPSHRQASQSEGQTVQHAIPLQVLVPSKSTPPADRDAPPHIQLGSSQRAPCSKAAATASVIAEDPAAASDVISVSTAASGPGIGAAALAAATEAMSTKGMPEASATAGVAQDRLAKVKTQCDEAFSVLEGKPSGNASHSAIAEVPSTATAAASEPESSAAREAAAHILESACQAAPDKSIPAPVPVSIAAAESLTVSAKLAAAGGVNCKQSKKRKSKYFSETFDQKKRRINRTRKTKAENRAARAVGVALPWSASTKGRSADSASMSGETCTPVSASLSPSISDGPGELHSTFFLLLH